MQCLYSLILNVLENFSGFFFSSIPTKNLILKTIIIGFTISILSSVYATNSTISHSAFHHNSVFHWKHVVNSTSWRVCDTQFGLEVEILKLPGCLQDQVFNYIHPCNVSSALNKTMKTVHIWFIKLEKYSRLRNNFKTATILNSSRNETLNNMYNITFHSLQKLLKSLRT